MFYDGVIEGKYVKLKSVQEADAEFTLELRKDPEFTKYLPELDITVEQQREWIRTQQQKKDDYFFVVFDKNDIPLGTYGLYDIRLNDTAESGRVALRGNAMQNIEVQLLVYTFAFAELGLNNIYGFIYTSNQRCQRYHFQFGAYLEEEVRSMYGTEVVKCVCPKEQFIEYTKKLKNFLYRQ